MMNVCNKKKTKKTLLGEQILPLDGQLTDEKEITLVVAVDDRGSFRRADNHPHRIYLYTFLRWAVNGNFVQEQVIDGAKIIRNNDSALASVQSLLADAIEAGSVDVFNAHSDTIIGGAEKNKLTTHLRTMCVKTDLSDLVGEVGLNYLLGGEKLCRYFASKFSQSDIVSRKGALWENLLLEAPSEWLTCPAQAESEIIFSDGNAKIKSKAGRPTTLDKKVKAVRDMIVRFERAASMQFTPNDLRGSAADLLDACQRFEKSNKIEPKVFSASQATFTGWLKAAGYSFPTGRTPDVGARLKLPSPAR